MRTTRLRFYGGYRRRKQLEGTLYCKEQDQRQWLLDVLAKKDFEACPKKGSGRHAKEHFTAVKKDEVITPADVTS